MGVQKIKMIHVSAKWLVMVLCGFLIILSVVLNFVQSVDAARFTNRSLTINSAVISDTTHYTIRFGFPTTASVGSVQFEFCTDPIPDEPCTTVPGLDVGAAILDSQSGETGFTVTQQTSNRLVLSRSPSSTGLQNNTYRLSGVVNPSVSEEVFYIRITSYASTNASGNFIDYGGVASVATRNVNIQTQVAPELIFCVAMIVPNYNCGELEGGNYVDFGELSSDQVQATQSQILVRTNAGQGYSISVHGIGVTSGNKTVESLNVPTVSAPGNGQFGINLTENNTPAIGRDQEGPGLTGSINPNYVLADQFLYNSGDTLVQVTGATDFKRYTVSYILNIPPTQAPGVYATTVTYICTGNF